MAQSKVPIYTPGETYPAGTTLRYRFDLYVAKGDIVNAPFTFNSSDYSIVTDGGGGGGGLTPEQEAKVNAITLTGDGNSVLTNNGTYKLPAEYTLVRESNSAGYAARYSLRKDNVVVGDIINIPLDQVLDSATIKTVTEVNVPYPGAQVGDKYIEFLFQGGHTPEYLAANDLVTIYTAGTGINISASNVISATETDPLFTTWKDGTIITAGSNANAAALGISIGSESVANGPQSVAIGANADFDGIGTTGVGVGSAGSSNYITTLGFGAVTDLAYGVSLGANSVLNGADLITGVVETYAPVSIGSSTNNITRRIINVKSGINDTDAVNVGQSVIYTTDGEGNPALVLKPGTKIAEAAENGDIAHEIVGINTYTDNIGEFHQFENGSQAALWNANILFDPDRTQGHATADLYNEDGSSAGKQVFAYLTDLRLLRLQSTGTSTVISGLPAGAIVQSVNYNRLLLFSNDYSVSPANGTVTITNTDITSNMTSTDRIEVSYNLSTI